MAYVGDYIRIVLSLVLLYFIYPETGWATTLCLALVLLRCEIMDYHDGVTF